MISLHQGSILDAATNVIVNPANGHLRHGGGLAAIIASAAKDYGKLVPITQPHGMHTGFEEDRIKRLADAWQAEQDEAPLVATGDALATSAGALSPYFRHIIHAVGPIWGGGQFHEADLLYSAHAQAIKTAARLNATSIAIPAISCGIFGYPVDQAATMAMSAAFNTVARLPYPMDVEFWLFEDAHMAAYQAELDCYCNVR